MADEVADCIVIGGGPAGLTAAIYLARYHLSVTVFDDNTSRAAVIPVSHNHAGFPDGISGKDLLDRMRKQTIHYGVAIQRRKVLALEKSGAVFTAHHEGGAISARSVLLATGVINRRPPMPQAQHDEAVARGLIRYCPVCDGFEVTDRAIGVIGTGTKGYKEALFLRSYTRDVTLISPNGSHELSPKQKRHLAGCDVRTVSGPVTKLELQEETISTDLGGMKLCFASVYPALGSDVRSELVKGLGARRSGDGCVIVDAHQRSSVPGLYAAGDVVVGLDQIGHAMGQAGVAATAIRNDLCELATLLR
ncbi:NAD(P)/FAD-dependent oxidoreductase [Rhizobium sp. LCM 4573]|uniref:NAD(P)/FAD-dependent oxidoreductase n=1 Tax=Rhizobium sp. LCM 4573 TaxID=1848291 RepID=UPI0008D9A4B9|nr:NAD(P)/FAD-dependent oxidoreductase [Rhizobium sp. LCM 4573]OHV76831.1 thioredoxin reductase [Rhizobium sp. LCM 4573]